jgi:hypothetical protein
VKRVIQLQVVLLLTLAVGTVAATSERARPAVQALLNNTGKADKALVHSAQAEAVRLYALIDIDLIWVTEVRGPDKRLHVVCLVNWEPSEKDLSSSVLGYSPAMAGRRGILAYVFLPRVERASQKFSARVDHVLAVSMAHEPGHMLLPDCCSFRRRPPP